MDYNQIIQIFEYSAAFLCGIISLLVANAYRVWRHIPLLVITLGLFFLGVTILLDNFTHILPATLSISEVTTYVRVVSALSLTIIGFTLLGFLFSFQNTKGFLVSLIIYFFIYGFGAGGYVYTPNLSVMWDAVSGWQYLYGGNDLTMIDLLIYLPIYELLILGFVRLRKKFRTSKSKQALILFLIGIGVLISTGTLSMIWGDLVFYGGLVIGFGFMCIAFIIDPMVYTITNVKIYDLVVCSERGCIARHTFDEKSGILSEHLFRGAFSGINSLMRETLLTRENLDFLQTGDKAVLIVRTSHLTIYLITNQMNRLCMLAMGILGRRIGDITIDKRLAGFK